MKPFSSETGTIALGSTEIPFTVTRNRRRRRTIGFMLTPTGTIRILAPSRTSMSSIRRLLHHRSEWIVKKLEEQRAASPAHPLSSFSDGETVTYLGYALRLQITRDPNRPQGCRIWPGRCVVNVPDPVLSVEGIAHEVKLELRLWMKKRARLKLQKRMDLWAAKLNVTYKKMAISSPERQWGSCSVDDIIRLNWRLIMAPLDLLDYVVAHELCHVVHKDHSRRFWRLLLTVMPDAMQRRKKLRLTGHALTLL